MELFDMGKTSDHLIAMAIIEAGDAIADAIRQAAVLHNPIDGLDMSRRIRLAARVKAELGQVKDVEVE